MRQATGTNNQDTRVMREPGPGRRLGSGLARRGAIGIAVACAVLAAGGITAVSVLGGGHGGGARPAANGAVSAGAAGTGHGHSAAAPMPEIAAPPQMAVMPKPASARSGHASPSGSHSAAPSGSASLPPAPTGTVSCTHPSYVTSAQLGMWNLAPYFVYNNMWNVNGYNVKQTLYACSYSDWYVVATMDNSKGDGAVKTYPDSHRDFSDPRISSLHSVTSTFAETSPHTGIYEDAYDIWINGIASSGSTEVMIWTDNHGQTPWGTDEGTVTFGGRSYTVWRKGTYIAFVANTNFTSGSMDLLQFFQWIIGKGWIPGSSTLSQVDYGVELVSTNGVPTTFSFSDFAVNAS